MIEELERAVDEANVSSWRLGGESEDRKGYVTFDAPGHIAFMEVVSRMQVDDKDAPYCTARIRALELIFQNIEELIESHKRARRLETSLAKLIESVPKDEFITNLLDAQKLLGE